MFGDYVEGGAFAPYVRERRFASSPLVGMMEIAQPPGDFSDPATGFLIVAQAMTPLKATCDFGFGRVSARVGPGNVAVQLPDMPAALVHDLPHAFRVAAIDVALLDRLTEDRAWLETVRRPGLETVESREIGPMLARLWQEAEGSDAASRVLVEGAAISLVGLLLRAAGHRPKRSSGGLAPWQLRRVTAYMMDHLDTEVGLAEVSALVGLSPSHFCTAFRQSTGQPPHAWLLRRRIERAQEMLAADPSLGLTEVAQAVGYAGQSAFGAAFRRITGTTPSAWRREARR